MPLSGFSGHFAALVVSKKVSLIHERLFGVRERLFGALRFADERHLQGSRCPYFDEVQDLVGRIATLVVSVHKTLAQNVQD